MPATATGSRYSSSVQLIRQRPARNEASRPKLAKGRGQSSGAGLCGPLARYRTAYPAPAGRSFPAYLLHGPSSPVLAVLS
jgi:hypothetical protein